MERRRPANKLFSLAVSSAKISRSDDKALDRDTPMGTTGLAGLSVRNGPVGDAMDVDKPSTNGAHKRKSRSSISNVVDYKDDSETDGEPLVMPSSAEPWHAPQTCVRC